MLKYGLVGSIGFEEIIVIAIVALIVWGGELPSIARKAGQQFQKLKNYLQNVREDMLKNIPPEDTLPADNPGKEEDKDKKPDAP